MTRHVSVSREIAAAPEAVFAAISDVTRMGEWSPECHTCEWNEGSNGPAVGAMFTGHNRNAGHEWTTEGRVIACEPGARFVFDALFKDFRFATWGYEIEATENGSRVTETWEDHRPQEIVDTASAVSGVDDRATHNRAGMESTLAALAAALE